jgi:aminoglycoside/choline kinase family phosphotransferase
VSHSRPSRESDAIIAELVAAQLGGEVSRIERLHGALGLRSFSRVWLETSETKRESTPKTLVARIDTAEDPSRRPAGIPPEPPLEPIRALLEAEGLPVPRRFAGDPARGVELLEDLGEISLADHARTASEAELESLYAEACELPPRLQRIEPREGVANFQRRLDAAHLRYKAERFARWSLGGDRAASPAEAEVVRVAFERIGRVLGEAPQRLAHRDLQSANLHVVDPSVRVADPSSRAADPSSRAADPSSRAADPSNRVADPSDRIIETSPHAADPSRDTARGRRARLVMIDLQGALMAPPEYDLVCLLRDSYLELDDAAVDTHLARARGALPDCPDEELFRLRFDLLTLTRKAKDHALFRAVAAERGDDRYLRYLPATRRYLQKASSRVASEFKEYSDLNDLIQAIPELS